MTDHSCEHIDDARAWALGILPEDRVDRFLTHLVECSICKGELERAEHLLDAMIDAIPVATPPPELRARVMEGVKAEAALSRAADEPLDWTRARGGRRRIGPALLVGAVVGAVIAVIAVVSVRDADTARSPSPSTRTIPGRVTEAGGGERARAEVITQAAISRLELTGLAAPPRGQVYQVWVVRARGQATPTGSLFSVPRSGNTSVSLPRLRDVEKVIVTAEPPRGSRTPTLPAVAVVPLPR